MRLRPSASAARGTCLSRSATVRTLQTAAVAMAPGAAGGREKGPPSSCPNPSPTEEPRLRLTLSHFICHVSIDRKLMPREKIYVNRFTNEESHRLDLVAIGEHIILIVRAAVAGNPDGILGGPHERSA